MNLVTPCILKVFYNAVHDNLKLFCSHVVLKLTSMCAVDLIQPKIFC
jgi:hypothetical protein